MSARRSGAAGVDSEERVEVPSPGLVVGSLPQCHLHAEQDADRPEHCRPEREMAARSTPRANGITRTAMTAKGKMIRTTSPKRRSTRRSTRAISRPDPESHATRSRRPAARARTLPERSVR